MRNSRNNPLAGCTRANDLSGRLEGADGIVSNCGECGKKKRKALAEGHPRQESGRFTQDSPG